MFDIYFTAEHVSETESNVDAVYGKLCIGEYSETFVASLLNWNSVNYEQHWENALERVAFEKDSALITSYLTADQAEFLVWWPLYVDGDHVHVQNELLIYSQLSKPFSIEHPWNSLRSRQTIDSEGLVISEWTTTVQQLQECLDRLRQRMAAEK